MEAADGVEILVWLAKPNLALCPGFDGLGGGHGVRRSSK